MSRPRPKYRAPFPPVVFLGYCQHSLGTKLISPSSVMGLVVLQLPSLEPFRINSATYDQGLGGSCLRRGSGLTGTGASVLALLTPCGVPAQQGGGSTTGSQMRQGYHH